MGRVTGLDPAMPGFHLLASDKTRLDSTDAMFVDVIHSCGGVLGFLQPLGTVDFYPNAGTAVQPGCCCVPELMGNTYEFSVEKSKSHKYLACLQRHVATDDRTRTSPKVLMRRRD